MFEKTIEKPVHAVRLIIELATGIRFVYDSDGKKTELYLGKLSGDSLDRNVEDIVKDLETAGYSTDIEADKLAFKELCVEKYNASLPETKEILAEK